MFKHTIFDLLKSLSVKEKNKLTDFISSPYFNKSQTVAKLYNELIKYYPSFIQDELNKENLYGKIINNSTYKDTTVRKFLHDLQELLLEFLVQQRFRSMKGVRDDYLLKELMLRNKKLYYRNVKRIESEITKKHIDTESFYERFLLETNKFNFEILNLNDRKMNKVNEMLDINSKGKMNFIIYYTMEILHSNINLICLKYNYGIKYEDSIIYSFVENIDIDNLIRNFRKYNKDIFHLELYFLMYKAMNELNNNEYYSKYKNLLLDYSDRLSQSSKCSHYQLLVNYFVIKRMSTNSRNKTMEYEQELFYIYEIILKNSYYIDDKTKYVGRNLFRNILLTGYYLEESKWLLKCINKYSEKLHPDNKDNMRNYGYAFYYNLQKDYKKSLDYINKVSLDLFPIKFDMKNLSLKNFFELNYIEEALNLIHSYRENLRYNRMLNKITKLSHRNFLLYYERILMYKIDKIKVDIDNIKEKLNMCDKVESKEWLLEKIEELEKGV